MNNQLSDARLAANRANALKSTGPRTDAGKAISSQNATTHGLTSKRMTSPSLLEGESQEDFDELRNDYVTRFRPADALEVRMVDNIVSIEWQLRRYRTVEESLIEMEMADPLCGVLTGVPMQETTGQYKIAKAFDQLAERRSLQLAGRIITRLNRELAAAIKLFLDLRKKLPVQIEPNPCTPTIEEIQIEPNPSLSTPTGDTGFDSPLVTRHSPLPSPTPCATASGNTMHP